MNRINAWIEALLVQPIAAGSSTLMRATVWLVFISGYALSALVFYRWASLSFTTMLFTDFVEPKEIIHSLLLSIELLILVPVPGIVGIVTYRTLMNLSDTESDLMEIKAQVQLAEQLLLGLLVTVTGATMLDVLILGEGTLNHFGGGLAIIIGLAFFYWLSGR